MIKFDMKSDDINYNAYNDKAFVYIDKNPGGTTGGLTPVERARRFKRYLAKGKVLEIGAGAGGDTESLILEGFDVIASDFVPSFLEILHKKKLNVIKFDGKTDDIPSEITPLDGVYVNAVFVHFRLDDFKIVLSKIHKALREKGYLFFSVMIGNGTEIAGRAKGIEREFFYYQEGDLKKLLEETGFILDKIEFPIDEKWIHIICHKE